MNHIITSKFIAIGLLVSPLSATAQAVAETQAVQQTIRSFFDGMRRADSATVRRTLAPGAVFHTVNSRNNQTRLQAKSPADFLKAVGTPHEEIWDERITFDNTLIDANLASVWTPYEFYLGPKFSHGGYNSFQLVKLAKGWRIAHIIDTRRKDKCK